MNRQLLLSLVVFAMMVGGGLTYKKLQASDHDDGENDVKSRALNLTDHYVWKDTGDATKLDFVQSSNPRSLAGQQYYFSAQARYEIHVTRASSNSVKPSGSDDVTFRFEFAAQDTNGNQAVTFTVLNSGNVVGSDLNGTTQTLAQSQAAAAGSGTGVQSVSINGVAYKYFAGLREDTFNFDVERFFEVREFLANAFFGTATATSVLASFQTNHKTCDGHYYLQGFTSPYDNGAGTQTSSGDASDTVHLFNPPGCAPDFTFHYNRNEIELQVPISSLQAAGETTFDTWSTISIPN